MDEMSDSEMWAAIKQQAQEKKRNNKQSSTAKLVEKGVEFESKIGGVHLIVQAKDGLVDYWPSTGKFIPRGFGRKGRGIRNLLKLCEQKQSSESGEGDCG